MVKNGSSRTHLDLHMTKLSLGRADYGFRRCTSRIFYTKKSTYHSTNEVIPGTLYQHGILQDCCRLYCMERFYRLIDKLGSTRNGIAVATTHVLMEGLTTLQLQLPRSLRGRGGLNQITAIRRAVASVPITSRVKRGSQAGQCNLHILALYWIV